MNKQQQPGSAIHDTICPLSTCVPIFNLLGPIVPDKSVTKKFSVENWNERKMKK